MISQKNKDHKKNNNTLLKASLILFSLILLISLANALTRQESLDAFENIDDIKLTIDDDYGQVKLTYPCIASENRIQDMTGMQEVTGNIITGYTILDQEIQEEEEEEEEDDDSQETTFGVQCYDSCNKALIPILECVEDNNDGTYTAYFGYENQNTYSVDVPIGSNNKFNPAPQNKGQPTTFYSGTTESYPNNPFNVRFDNCYLRWTLEGPDNKKRIITATCNSPKCPEICSDNDNDGFTDCNGDCNDDDNTIYPGAEELCDGKDNDCGGTIDEGCCSNYLCIYPDILDDIQQEDIQIGNNPYYDDLQKLLDEYEEEFNLNITEDQTNDQIWHTTNDLTTLEIELIGKGIASNSNVFGYYLNSSISSFTPLFQMGNHSQYNTPIFSPGQKTTITIETGKGDIGFGIDSENSRQTSNYLFVTENNLNPDSQDHAIVYDLCENEYIIAFEDLLFGSSDLDYEDLVVKIKVINCSDLIPEPECGNGILEQDEECDDGNLIDGDGCSGECTLEQAIDIIAYKIVCEDESDLPDWGNGGPTITSTTAQDFINSHPNCNFQEGWNFQWNYQGSGNPGDHTGLASGWNTFGPTDSSGKTEIAINDITNISRFELREEFREGYILFTHSINQSNHSAEFYCHNDVLNYDNYDYITNPQAGNTYYCIGFNVPIQESYCGDGVLDPDEECDDGNNYDGDGCSSICEIEISPSNQTCPDFPKLMGTINNISKISFTKFFMAFSIESLDNNQPIVSMYENYYTINPFELCFGPICYNSSQSGTITDYLNILNNNEITHEYITEGSCSNIIICNHSNSTSWNNNINGKINLNPNNNDDFEFWLEKPDHTWITRDNLHGSYGEFTYNGPALAIRFKPKGNGNQNTLIVDGESYDLKNGHLYTIRSTNMYVEVYNDRSNTNGNSMGHWWIDNIQGYNSTIIQGEDQCSYQTICNTSCTCETKITTYGPIRCIVDRILYHAWKWLNQAPDDPLRKAVHSVLKTIGLMFFDESSFEEDFTFTDLEDNSFSLYGKFEAGNSIIDQITSSAPYQIPPPGEYPGHITIEDIEKDYSTIINPVTRPWDKFNCFADLPDCTDNDNDGYNSEGGVCGSVDCDDSNPSINPGEIEICNNIDDNCNNEIDENIIRSCGTGTCTGTQECLFGTWSSCSSEGEDAGTCAICSTEGIPEYDNSQDYDCIPTICPEDRCNVDICGENIYGEYPDHIENECNGLYSCTENNCQGTAICEEDSDSDGYSTLCGDCNDNDNTIYPEAEELCDEKDNDCDGEIDEGCEYCEDDFFCYPRYSKNIKVEMLEKRDECNGKYTYRFKITNYLKNALSYVAIELPAGIVPSWPADNSIYEGENNNYNIENPTNNPFYSIKYETIGEGIKYGSSEIFEFTLDQDTEDYPISIQAKAGNKRADVILSCTGTSCGENCSMIEDEDEIESKEFIFSITSEPKTEEDEEEKDTKQEKPEETFRSNIPLNITEDKEKNTYLISTEEQDKLVEFSWNFTTDKTPENYTIEYDKKESSIAIKGLETEGSLKTVYITKPDENYNYVCILDKEVEDIDEITENCTGSEEIRLSCPGSYSQYSCEDTGKQFKILGLSHSAVKGLIIEEPETEEKIKEKVEEEKEAEEKTEEKDALKTSEDLPKIITEETKTLPEQITEEDLKTEPTEETTDKKEELKQETLSQEQISEKQESIQKDKSSIIIAGLIIVLSFIALTIYIKKQLKKPMKRKPAKKKRR